VSPAAIAQEHGRTRRREHLGHVMGDALGHGQSALAHPEGQDQFALGVHRQPDPVRRTLKALDGRGRTALRILNGAEHGTELVQLHLTKV
jgi:hypothetical protein